MSENSWIWSGENDVGLLLGRGNALSEVGIVASWMLRCSDKGFVLRDDGEL